MRQVQYSTVLCLPGVQRYEYFIEKVVNRKEVWVLRRGNRLAQVVVADGKDIGLFWPEKVFAEASRKAEWEGYSPEAVPLNDFIRTWLPNMIRYESKMEIFPTPAEEGLPLSPRDVLHDLKNELARGA